MTFLRRANKLELARCRSKQLRACVVMRTTAPWGRSKLAPRGVLPKELGEWGRRRAEVGDQAWRRARGKLLGISHSCHRYHTSMEGRVKGMKADCRTSTSDGQNSKAITRRSENTDGEEEFLYAEDEEGDLTAFGGSGIDPDAPCVNMARGVLDEVDACCQIHRDRSRGYTFVKGEFPLSDMRWRPSNPDLMQSTDPRHYYLKDVFLMVR